jgi:hypothetical protein
LLNCCNRERTELRSNETYSEKALEKQAIQRAKRPQGSRDHGSLNRFYESNGPDVKVRGPAAIVAEKYLQLARDAQASGDLIAAEGYLQHAEHYNRLIAAAQEQLRQ